MSVAAAGLLAAGCELPGSYFDRNPDACTPGAVGPVGRWYVHCDGTVTDTQTNRQWQQEDSKQDLNWSSAKTYCEILTLAGHSDWRLPNIDDLRSLIVDCPGTMSGGECGVTTGCLDDNCRNSACGGCSNEDGPDEGGRYATPGVWEWSGGGWARSNWSSSEHAGGGGFAWYVAFDSGGIYVSDLLFNVPRPAHVHWVRCVRP